MTVFAQVDGIVTFHPTRSLTYHHYKTQVWKLVPQKKVKLFLLCRIHSTGPVKIKALRLFPDRNAFSLLSFV
ncbi:hypothetical protein GCM10027293_16350 [Pontibacter aydingkolensis]